MASNRMGRVNSDITASLANIIREVKDPRVQQGLVTVTGTDANKDLSYCKVYISVLGLESEKELRRGLRAASGWIRKELARRLQLRNTPELEFVLDTSIQTGAYINSIINSLDIRPEDPEEEADE